MSRSGKVNISRNPTSPIKACTVAVLALLGVLLSHYGLAWPVFGMGYNRVKGFRAKPISDFGQTLTR